MKKYALINNQTVENITVSDIIDYKNPDFEETILLSGDSDVEIGFKYINSTFIEREKTPEELQIIQERKIFEIREQRSVLLKDSDIFMLKDNWEKLTESQQNDWITYRQALRDITLQDGFPHDVTWPVKP